MFVFYRNGEGRQVNSMLVVAEKRDGNPAFYGIPEEKSIGDVPSAMEFHILVP
jgi:hypothetical protein